MSELLGTPSGPCQCAVVRIFWEVPEQTRSTGTTAADARRAAARRSFREAAGVGDALGMVLVDT